MRVFFLNVAPVNSTRTSIDSRQLGNSLGLLSIIFDDETEQIIVLS